VSAADGPDRYSNRFSKAEWVNENETCTHRPNDYRWCTSAAVGHGLHSTVYGFLSGHGSPPLKVRIVIIFFRIGQRGSGQFICYKTGQFYLLLTIDIVIIWGNSFFNITIRYIVSTTFQNQVEQKHQISGALFENSPLLPHPLNIILDIILNRIVQQIVEIKSR